MKRALAVLLAFVGFSAFGIGTFSGSWKFGMCTDGTISTNVLTINYVDLGMTFTGTLDIPQDSFTFGVKGSLGGLLNLDGSMTFDIGDAAYMKGKFVTSLVFAGVDLSLTIQHWNASYLPTDPKWQDYCDQTPTQGFLLFTLGAKIAPFAIELVMADCCTGIEFNSIEVTLEDLSLCCGISYDVEWVFTKAGFDHITFTADPLFDICCGITFGLEVEFGANYKQVTPLIKFKGLAAECLTIGATVGTTATKIESLTIDYVGITCKLGDCSNILFGTAFTGKQVGTIVIDDKTIAIIKPNAPSAWGLSYSFVANDLAYFEYETIQLTVCGVTCCGGKFTGTLKAYWGNLYDYVNNAWVQVPTLFGLSRLSGSFSLPLADMFSLNLSMDYNLFLKTTKMCFGWTFKF